MKPKGKPNKRTIERILNAAASLDDLTPREQCMVGGIVRTLVDTGQFDPRRARHAATALTMLGRVTSSSYPCGIQVGTDMDGIEFPDDWWRLGQRLFPEMTDVTEDELRPIVARFKDAYEGWGETPTPA